VNRAGHHRVRVFRALLVSLLTLAASLFAHSGRGQEASSCSFSLSQPLRSRGDALVLSVTNGPSAAASVAVTFTGNAQSFSIDRPTYAAASSGTPARVVGRIASSVALGAYLPEVQFDGTPCPASDSRQWLRVVPPGNPAIHLDKFDPPYSVDSMPAMAGAARGNPRTVNLVLRGRGFQVQNPQDNVLYLNSVRQSVAAGDCSAAADEGAPPRTLVAQLVNDQEIDLCRVPVPDGGELRVQVAVGDQTSEPQIFRVYAFGKTSVALMAALVALILALLPLLLLSWVKESYTISRQDYKLRLLFLDPQTDTYSLSKLQFYLWTNAALFGYAYLFISRVLIQHGIWPDIPPNLPGVIAIAAGTSVSSQVITSSKGSKGAGALYPSFADFITSGGVVAPDRLQMLLWTLFGVGAFIVSTLGQAPASIQDLPTVPDHLLYMMGLSSAGYLGGKLARKAGPVINEISVSPADPDDAIIAAACAASTDATDFTEAIAAAQARPAAWGTPSNGHTQAALAALSEAVSAVRAAQNTAAFTGLLATLAALRQRADAEALAAAQDFEAQPTLAQDAATAQSAAAALQELSASATQAISQSAAFTLREAADRPGIARTITLRGSNLSAEALFQFDRQDLPFRMLQSSDGKHIPNIIVRDTGTPTFASVLELAIDPAHLDEHDLEQLQTWFGTKGVHTFTLTNPDGQMAEVNLPLPPGTAQKSGTAS
jgi:hypothetical protein